MTDTTEHDTPTDTADTADTGTDQEESTDMPDTLVTSWANSTDTQNFDDDQANIDNWATIDSQIQCNVLETRMTLADAEELIATCRDVATEHEARAERARKLARTVADRLGRARDQAQAADPAETKLMPLATDDLPSAL